LARVEADQYVGVYIEGGFPGIDPVLGTSYMDVEPGKKTLQLSYDSGNGGVATEHPIAVPIDLSSGHHYTLSACLDFFSGNDAIFFWAWDETDNRPAVGIPTQQDLAKCLMIERALLVNAESPRFPQWNNLVAAGSERRERELTSMEIAYFGSDIVPTVEMIRNKAVDRGN
jgi:hypothetical protein